jgi:hypothetical protein
VDFILGRMGSEELRDKLGHGMCPGFDPEEDLRRVGVANQTTMLMSETMAVGEEIRKAMVERYGEENLADHFELFDTICSATQERQDAVLALLEEPLDLMVVVGGYNSSNTCHLAALVHQHGVRTYHIEDADAIDLENGAIRHQPIGTKSEITAENWLGDARVIGITAGIVAGIRRGGFMDNLVLVSTLFVVSIPVFVIGFVAQIIFGVQLGWFPVTSDGSLFSLILPGFVLGSLSLAYVARLMRTNLVENLRADYVRTAVAKGMPRKRVIGVHAVRNSLIPVITFIGADFGSLIGGAIVTEGIFNVNGVGNLIFRSIRGREGATVTAAVTVLVLIFLLVNLFVDLLYAVLDPRIRYD